MASIPDQASAKYQALLQLLRTADTIWNASRIFFSKWDLTPSQFNVLNLLRANSRGLSQTELSRQLIMHRSNVTGLIDRLEQRALVERKDAAGDRRVYRVVLTRSGAALLDRIQPEYLAGAEQLWSKVTPKRITETIADLRAVSAAAAKIAATSAAEPDRRIKG
jgi:DNA-binding MarR family transcriptional regulator